MTDASTYTTTSTPAPPWPADGDLVGTLAALKAKWAANPDIIDCFVLLTADLDRLRLAMGTATDTHSTLAGIPVHVVDGVQDGWLAAYDLGLRGRRVGVVGRLADEMGVAK